MPPTWYVTFEVQYRGVLPKRRSSRETRTFDSEAAAKAFARARLDEGLVVSAGTLNPHRPTRHVPSGSAQAWIAEGQQDSPDLPPRHEDDDD
jgi:hypothetical protein